MSTQAVTATAPVNASPPVVLQRKCACSALAGQCEDCQEKSVIQRRAVAKQHENLSVPPVVSEVLSSPGEQLPEETRAYFESRLGHDFSRVRIHTGAASADSARAVNAHAFTVGQHIVFDANQYSPDTPGGRQLLAHELTHTIQQTSSAQPMRAANESIVIGATDDPREREAERCAAGINNSEPVSVTAPAGDTGGNAVVLRRDEATGGAQTQQQGQRTSLVSAQPVQWQNDVDLGRFGRYYNGRADARLDRTAALAHMQRGATGDRPPCQIDLFLKLEFDFHLGPSPWRAGGPQGQMTEPGPPWPPARAARWKQEYMRVAQQFWRTRHTLERTGDCANEPCTFATGQLRIIDAQTMTDSTGQRVPNAQMSSMPHFTVHVYEFRPLHGRNESRVGFGQSTMYEEDVVPRDRPRPQGHDESRYAWRPGAAEHETGHMLGRPHINCAPDNDNPNDERCYGETDAQRANVMGRGGEMSREDHAPFLMALQRMTGCSWQVPRSGLPWWAMVLIGLTGVGLIVLGIMALAGAL